MAKLSNGFLGDASGKLGNVVFSKWKRINTARSYQGKISDANSPAQKTQRLRMSALQSFLSPLNNNFIKFFNSKFVVNSTPWAKAIKDNMPAVDELGNIDLTKITFGNNKLPPVKILNSDYDPFIDCLTIKYDNPDFITSNSSFPLIACSMLGMSKEYDQPHSFNLDNMLKYMPGSYFYCEYEDQGGTTVFTNYFDRGQFWLIPLSDYRWDEMYQSIPENTVPVSFVPISQVRGFNKKFDYNPIPFDILDISYEKPDSTTNLVINIDKKLIPEEITDDYSIALQVRLILREGYIDFEMTNLKISELPYTTTIPNKYNVVGLIVLYTVLNEDDQQISCFNTKYFGYDPNENFTPYFVALHMCYGACALSFKLQSNYTGIYGKLDELVSDFISAYESGIVTGNPETIEYKDFSVNIITDTGQDIGRAMINDKHDFYFANMIPSQTYFVYVLYQGELIDLWRKPPRKGGTVNYLSPASVVANHNQELLPKAILELITPLLAHPSSWNIPMESYTHEALELFHVTNPLKYKKTMRQDYPIIMDGTVDG